MKNNKISKRATEIFNKIIEILGENDSIKIDNTNTSFMPLSVEKLYSNTVDNVKFMVYSFSHFFEQNGDLCPDPDMTIIKTNTGVILPATIQTQFGYRVAIDTNDLKCNKRELNDQIIFLNIWLKNINEQQGIFKMKVEPKKEEIMPVIISIPKIETKINEARNFHYNF